MSMLAPKGPDMYQKIWEEFWKTLTKEQMTEYDPLCSCTICANIRQNYYHFVDHYHRREVA